MGRLDPPCTSFALPNDVHETLVELVGSGVRIVSSPLLRSSQTAEQIGFPFTIDRRLIERDLGEWSGTSHRSTYERYPEALLPTGGLDPLYTPPGGEQWSDFVERVTDAINDYSAASGPTLAITHNGVIRAMRIILNDIPAYEYLSDFEPELVISRISSKEPRARA